MNKTPTNLGKLIAKHQVKFIHGRTVSDLEDDINKRLSSSLGQYEIKSITLDMSGTGSRLGMIHYYEQSRITDINNSTPKINQYTSESVRKEVVRSTHKSATSNATKHIAPVVNTPATNNNEKEFGKIQINVDKLQKSEFDNLKPDDKLPSVKELSQPDQPDTDTKSTDTKSTDTKSTNTKSTDTKMIEIEAPAIDPATEIIENEML